MTYLIAPLTFNSFNPAAMAANANVLQTAIAAGGGLLMPPGVIASNGRLGQWASGYPLELRGAGKDITRLYAREPTYPAFEIGHPTPGGLIVLEKFAIIDDKASPTINMKMQSAGSPTLRDITLDHGYYGLHMFETFSAVLENVHITNSKGLGLYVQGLQTSNGYVLRNCRFFNVGHALSRAAILMEGGDAIEMTSVAIEGCHAGIEMPNCRGVTITTPYIERLTANPITFGGYAAGVTINGGWIGGHSGHSPSWWDISGVANLKLRGVTLFNLAIRRHVASTPGFDMDGCTLVGTTVQNV